MLKYSCSINVAASPINDVTSAYFPLCAKSIALSFIANDLNLYASGKTIPSFVICTFFKLNIEAIAESTSLTDPIPIVCSKPNFFFY